MKLSDIIKALEEYQLKVSQFALEKASSDKHIYACSLYLQQAKTILERAGEELEQYKKDKK